MSQSAAKLDRNIKNVQRLSRCWEYPQASNELEYSLGIISYPWEIRDTLASKVEGGDIVWSAWRHAAARNGAG